VAGVAYGGQIVVSDLVAALVQDLLAPGVTLRDLGVHRLKDLGRPIRIRQVCADGLPDEFPPLRSLDNPAVRHNLPIEPTSFVGRTEELASLRSLVLGEARLVTIVGPGGIGKSRLALHVAAEAVDGTGDGVWLAELAPLNDAEMVARSVAGVLGVREQAGLPMLDALVEAVGDRRLFIVVDNAEHVLDSTAKLADRLLRSCPRVRLVATSREPLGVAGEHLFRVPPLAVPPADMRLADELSSVDSVQLFVQRASQQRPDFVLDDINAPDVRLLCERLDGIPLAIELAAGRLRSLSISEINSRLDQRLRLLTGGSRSAAPRHQTLRALIDWSYEMLNETEQRILDRLSIFACGWMLDAAEAVASGCDVEDWRVLDHLATLVDKSLVQANEVDGSTRYRLLETVRQYAYERLASRPDPEAQMTARAHRDHYLALVEMAAPYLQSAEQVNWLDRIETEFDNIRAALAFSIADPLGPEPGLRLGALLRRFCAVRGYGAEVHEALDAMLERPDANQPTLIRARALIASRALMATFANPSTPWFRIDEALEIATSLGADAVTAEALDELSWREFSQGNLDKALSQNDEASRLGRAAGVPHLVARTLSHRAVYQGERGEWSTAFADHEKAIALVRAQGDFYRLAALLNNLAYDEMLAGELTKARAHLREASSLVHDCRFEVLRTTLTHSLGCLDILAGDPTGARCHFLDGLRAARVTGARNVIPNQLQGIAIATGEEADHALAATLHGASDQQFERAGIMNGTFERGMRDRSHSALRALIGDEAFDAAYQRGRALSEVDAIRLATTAASGLAVVPGGESWPGSET
jgi:predicted ATPase